MRLTEEQVLAAFEHDDARVRLSALRHFDYSYSRNPAVMPAAIGVLESRPLEVAFEGYFPFVDLRQTADTISWTIGRLRHAPQSNIERYLARRLSRVLVEADPELLLPHQNALTSLAGFTPKAADYLSMRFEIDRLPADRLWRRLEEIAAEGRKEHLRKRLPGLEIKAIVGALARAERNADRMMELLATKYDDDSSNAAPLWLDVFATRLAGEMRYEPAVPLLVEKLQTDWIVLTDESRRSLLKIGNDEVVAGVKRVYWDAPLGFSEDAAVLFGRIHRDAAATAGLEILSEIQEGEDRASLADELVSHFSTETFDACFEVFNQVERSWVYDLGCELLAASRIMNYRTDDMEQWEDALREPEQFFDGGGYDYEDDYEDGEGRQIFELADMDDDAADPVIDDLYDDGGTDDYGAQPEPLTRAAPVGRNDPCPCGSGKKYKKCCMREQPLP